MTYPNPKLIFLLGFMGSGKTHTGRLLAEKMELPFFDLDEYIEEKESASIKEIFEEKGETYFRNQERRCLRDFGVVGNGIVATGGGTPCFFDNMEWMNQQGVTIYLKTESSLLMERLKVEKSERPLLAKLQDGAMSEFVKEKLAERIPYYEQSSVVVEQDETDENIVEILFNHYLSITGH